MKFLKYGALGLVALIVVLLIVGQTLDKSYATSRTIVINAPVAVVYDLVSDLKKNPQWSPWWDEKAMHVTWGEVTAGQGGNYSWGGDSHGEGSMTITKAVPNEQLEIALDFGKQGRATAHWTFDSQPDGVHTVWSFSGEAEGMLGGYMAAMVDAMVAHAFDEGLASLKKVAETTPVAIPQPGADAPRVDEAAVPAEEG